MKATRVLRLPRSAVKGAADMLKQNENQIVDMNFHDAQKGKINLPIMRQNLYMQLKPKLIQTNLHSTVRQESKARGVA